MIASKLLIVLSFVLFSVQLASADYNETEAIEYAYTAAIAYCPPDLVMSWKCGVNCGNLTGYKPFYSEVFNVTANETLSLVMIYNPTSKKFITTYRGTAGSEQLLLEILEGEAVDFDLYSVPGALVDNYFYSHYLTYLRPVVLAQLQKAYKSYPDYLYVFTGHSLGGALTTLTAFDMIMGGTVQKNQALIYNFGSPRVGNQVLAQAIQQTVSEIYRLVHWRDTVPHLPPCKIVSGQCSPEDSTFLPNLRGIIWPAWHVAQEVFYDQSCSSYTLCQGGEDPTCSDKFLLAETDVLDHFYYLNIRMECHQQSVFSLPSLVFSDERDDPEVQQSIMQALLS